MQCMPRKLQSRSLCILVPPGHGSICCCTSPALHWLHAQAQKEHKEDKAAVDKVQQELSTLKALKEKKALADRQYAPTPASTAFVSLLYKFACSWPRISAIRCAYVPTQQVMTQPAGSKGWACNCWATWCSYIHNSLYIVLQWSSESTYLTRAS